jgi:outer membrane protein TolC
MSLRIFLLAPSLALALGGCVDRGVLSRQNQVLTVQGLGAELEARRLTFSVDLVRALGGGYTPPAG